MFHTRSFTKTKQIYVHPMQCTVADKEVVAKGGTSFQVNSVCITLVWLASGMQQRKHKVITLFSKDGPKIKDRFKVTTQRVVLGRMEPMVLGLPEQWWMGSYFQGTNAVYISPP